MSGPVPVPVPLSELIGMYFPCLRQLDGHRVVVAFVVAIIVASDWKTGTARRHVERAGYQSPKPLVKNSFALKFTHLHKAILTYLFIRR
jgi:hypothetical protein